MSLLQRIALNTKIPKGLCYFSAYKPGIRPSPVRESKLISKDQIPEGYQIIYKAPMENYLKALNLTSTVSATIVGLVAAFQYGKNLPLDTVSDDFLFTTRLVSAESDLLYFGIGFIVLNIVIRIFISKYALRIYKNNERYIAVFSSQLPFKTTKVDFLKGEVLESKSIFLNPWRDQMFNLGKKESLLLIDYFKSPSEFTQMLK